MIKSHVQNAIATSFIGMLYGPIFPACLAMANDILPAEVHMVAMALMYVQFDALSRKIRFSLNLFVVLLSLVLEEVSKLSRPE